MCLVVCCKEKTKKTQKNSVSKLQLRAETTSAVEGRVQVVQKHLHFIYFTVKSFQK